MDEKLKIFWNLDVLVKMCRSKSDGPSLRVEEEEILEKISAYEADIEEIKSLLEEDVYDTSAEMADRNIEIITKKQLQSLKAELKEKNKELNRLKDAENVLYSQTSLLRENKASNEKYIASMQERLSENTDRDVLDRYNALITETLTKINELAEQLREENASYESVQTDILQASADVEDLEARIEKKKRLLAETQASLENKDNYIDKSKREKNERKINEITSKIEGLQKRLEEIRKDPKYIETKIKDIINSKEDKQNAREYLVELVNLVIDVPYINVPADNNLEEELLRATQARDSFANEIDQKSYNILEANTPEKIRTDFLNRRIENWKMELDRYQDQIRQVDRDVQYNYEEKDRQLEEMIKGLKNDLKEFERAYAETSETNIGARASIEVALEEKKEDIQEAEKIANAFKTNEAEDIANATRTIKYQCEQINNNIAQAEEEIKRIRNRLMSRKSGLIDIASRNKDKDVLKDLAQTVIDIKHRRQFPETPQEIIRRLEEELDIAIIGPEELEKIQKTSEIESKNYDEYISKKYEVPVESAEDIMYENFEMADDKALEEVNVMNPEDLIETSSQEEEFQKLADQAMGVDSTEDTEEEPPVEEVPVEEAPIEEEPVEEPVIEETPEAEVASEPEETEEPVKEEKEEETSEEDSEEKEVEEPTEKDETPVDEEPPAEETTEEVVEETPAEEEAPIEEPEEKEEPTEEEVPVEEEPAEPAEEAVEEVPVEETPIKEEPAVEEITEEIPAEEAVTEEPVVEEAMEEPVIEETPIEEQPIEEPAEEEVEETPVVEETTEPIVEAPVVEEGPQENPFGDVINPLANEKEEPTVPEEEPVVELSSNVGDDLSIDSMFSNSIELSEQKDKEEVRNNLSDELDNFLNNLDDKNE